ncbi:SPOR domain-containing protein [Vibrio cyclitrophicus]
MNKQLALLTIGMVYVLSIPSVSAQENVVSSFLEENCRVSMQPHDLPVLASTCPLGQALYKGISPNANLNGFYWVQCGASTEPFSSLLLLEKLASVTSSHLVQSHDGEYYRCLTGPYYKYEDANQVARYASKLLSIDVFVRESQLVKPVVSVFNSSVENAESKQQILPSNELVDPIIINRTEIGDLSYFIPVFYDDSFSFYSEKDKEWNRFTYSKAVSACESLNAELVNSDDLKRLSQHESVDTWPKILPYWIIGGYVRNFEGEEYSSTKNSKLYLMCRQPLNI